MTVEFDYRLGQARTALISNNSVERIELLRWVASHIAEQCPEPAWVTTYMEPIVKASLSFLTKFWWAIVRSDIQPILVDNTLTSERVVLVANILAIYDIYWARLIMKQIYESPLKRAISILFPVLVYKLCLHSQVEILHQLDLLVDAQHTLEVGLINDNKNSIATQ